MVGTPPQRSRVRRFCPPYAFGAITPGATRGSVRAMKHVAILSAALAFGVIANHAQAEDATPGPVFSDSGPDAAEYGAAAGFQPGTLKTAGQVEHLVSTYSHFDALVPTRPVARAPQ